MSKEREALKLALEGLEYIHEGANNQGPHTGISWRCVSNKAEPAITAIREALADSALDRMAENARELGLDYEPIVEQVEDSVGMGHKAWDMVDPKELAKEFHKALAEPPCKTGSQCTNKCQQCEQPAQKQEPKRWAVFCSECRKEWSVSYPHPGKSICAECDAKAGAQQQEPVSVMTVLHLKDRTEIGYGPASAGYDLPTGEYKLYTSPPASKPWVGLTDEERNKIWRDVIGWGDPSHDDEDLMKAIEAKLKERNTCQK